MKKHTRAFKSLLTVLLLLANFNIYSNNSSKREFRGVWLQTAFQDRFINNSTEESKKYLIKALDRFVEAGFNAVIFQVRPSADAFYCSDIEPVSRFMTGKQGRPGSATWDPMEFLIEECHKRCIEFHAWINPYRVTVSKNEKLAPGHLFHSNPELFIRFNDKIYFDPGQPQSRSHIRRIVKDIVTRYDVDAIHFDDYFYPYPVKGKSFNDKKSFAIYGPKMGYHSDRIDDWRRHNVNILIRNLSQDIKEVKPWVLFGISPFGIYRNEKSDPSGSKTSGLQNYDDLYADVLLWSRESWIDYVIPQVYWEIGHPAADYVELTNWWSKNSENSHLFIGQSISRSLDDKKDLRTSDKHLEKKISMTRESDFITGNCFWYGYQIADNESGIFSVLKDKYHTTKALIPAFEKIDNRIPDNVKKLKAEWTVNGYKLMWNSDKNEDEILKHAYYCIYRFHNKEKVDISNSENIVAITKDNSYLLPYENGKTKYIYVVTALNRLHTESEPEKKKVKL